MASHVNYRIQCTPCVSNLRQSSTV